MSSSRWLEKFGRISVNMKIYISWVGPPKAAERLEAALGMDIEQEGEGEGEGGEGGDRTQREWGALEFLTQDAEPSGTTLIYSRNRFNEISHLKMLWTVGNCWPAGSRFVFNCYRHWAQLLLRQPGDQPVKILIQEGVTQGDTLSMVLYRITLASLADG